MEAVVIRSYGKYFVIELEDGTEAQAMPVGKLRLIDNKFTSPVAVGDKVEIFPSEEEGKFLIKEIKHRKNYLIKRSHHRKTDIQVIASNIDQAILLASIKKPFTPLRYIDKFTVMCEAFDIEPVIIFNKTDLLSTEKDKKKLSDYLEIYKSVGYNVFAMNAKDIAYQNQAREILQGKISLLVGVSGVGKSTFVNLVKPSLNLKTQPLAKHTQRGKHTTTFVAMYSIEEKTRIIDAPGFYEFELIGIGKNELSHYFPEMRALLPQCKFSDCTHLNEPDCAVMLAVATGEIPQSRYNTYANIYYEIEENEIYDR